MAEHNDFGKLAEDIAHDFLIRSGYKILTRNYRFQKAEIDLVAESDDTIVIVEVKARKTNIFLEPQEAVTRKKIRLLVAAADAFMRERNHRSDVRFDIISVLPDLEGKLQITHLKDAFEAFDAN